MRQPTIDSSKHAKQVKEQKKKEVKKNISKSIA